MESDAPERRKNLRFAYVHKLTVHKSHLFFQGHSVDISDYGMKVAVEGKVDEKGGYRARLHIQRDQGLQVAETLVEQEGVVKWIYSENGTSILGIEFIDPINVNEIFNEQLQESDYCYLHISHSSLSD